MATARKVDRNNDSTTPAASDASYVIDPDVFACADLWDLLSRDMQGKAIFCRPRSGTKGLIDKCLATSAMLLARFATLWFAVIVGFVALAILRSMYPSLRPAAAPSPAPPPRESVDNQGAT